MVEIFCAVENKAYLYENMITARNSMLIVRFTEVIVVLCCLAFLRNSCQSEVNKLIASQWDYTTRARSPAKMEN